MKNKFFKLRELFKKKQAKNFFSTAVWNIGASGINFTTNFLLARLLGVSIFGDFSLYSSSIALLSLTFVLIPNNFALFKYQEDEDFKFIFTAFYQIMSLVYALLLFLLTVVGIIQVPFFTSLLYSLSLALFSYFDVTYQAEGKLSAYYFQLFISAFAKLISFLSLYYFNFITSFNNLLITLSIGQIIVLLIYGFTIRSIFIKSFFYLKKTIKYISSNIKVFKNYYLNTAIKQLDVNINIIFFNQLLTKNELGIFSLIMKSLSFSWSLFRIFESYLFNKNKFERSYNQFTNNKVYLAITLQCFFCVISVLYLFVLTQQLYLLEILFMSIASYPLVYMMLLRVKLLSRYDSKSLNIAQIGSVSTYTLFFIVGKLFHISNLIFCCLGVVTAYTVLFQLMRVRDNKFMVLSNLK